MALWQKVLLALLVVGVAFVGFVAIQPSEYRVTRSATMNASAAEVFAQVNDFQKWEAWSPWAKLDPAAKNTFEGPASGTGAIFHWDGNDKVGAGSLTITESRPNEKIQLQLAFIRPFEDTCTTEFTFQPHGEQTEVTWSMFGKKDFIGKACCLFMDMDKMIGGDFENGLASIKKIVEVQSSADDAHSDDSQTPTKT
jgi:hypothetical protein